MEKLIEYLKIILPIIAIGISIISLIISRKNFRRQIRITKLEEMIENYFYVCGHYWHFRLLIEELKNIDQEKDLLQIKAFKKQLKILREKEVFEKITLKSNRVGVLANSYLHNGDLKFQIISSCRLIREMMQAIDNENLLPISGYNKLASRTQFARIIEMVEKELIKEMDLGYESHNWNDLNNYYKNEFKKQLLGQQ